jgi:hypothetical protein
LACSEFIASLNDFGVLISDASIAAVKAKCTFGGRSVDVRYASASRTLSVGYPVRWERRGSVDVV